MFLFINNYYSVIEVVRVTCVCAQVNGLDTVRVPLSVGPYVDPRTKKLMKLEAAAATENKPETDSE